VRALNAYTRVNAIRKPESLSPKAYPRTLSVVNYGGADRVLGMLESAVAAAEETYERLDEIKKDSFYQLVLYPAKATLNVLRVHVYAEKNNYYAALGSPEANRYAELARAAFEEDAKDERYYNKTLAGGKWDGIMIQPHFGQTGWRSSAKNVPPELTNVSELRHCEGRGDEAIQDNEEPRPVAGLDCSGGAFAESDGCVSIEAEHFTRSSASPNGAAWTVFENYGRTLSSIKVMPNGHESFVPKKNSPTVEYNIFTRTQVDDLKLTTYVAPTNNLSAASRLRYGIQLDDGAVVITETLAPTFKVDNSNVPWSDGVMNNIRELTTNHGRVEPGLHKITLYSVDAGVVVQKIVADLGGVKESYLGPEESDRV